MIIGLGGQYIGNWHNNKSQISSVEIHIGVVDMHTLLPQPHHNMFDIYDNHADSQSFICIK